MLKFLRKEFTNRELLESELFKDENHIKYKKLFSLMDNIFPEYEQLIEFITFMLNRKADLTLRNRICNKFGRVKPKVFLISGMEGTGKTFLVELFIEVLFGFKNHHVNIGLDYEPLLDKIRRDTLKKINLIVVDEVRDIKQIEGIIEWNHDKNIIMITNSFHSKGINSKLSPDIICVQNKFNRLHDIDRKEFLNLTKEFFEAF